MGFRILIADDEPIIRVDLKELLEEMGHEIVAEAQDGSEALHLINQKKPDVVILDIKMPSPDGLELAKKFRNQYPIIILTAYSERHLIDQARETGVMSYLTKPFRESDLSPAIELAVSHFLNQSELNERITRLKKELETRKRVEKAKGLLMEKDHISEAQAYRRIQKLSMEKNKPIKDVADAIILMLD